MYFPKKSGAHGILCHKLYISNFKLHIFLSVRLFIATRSIVVDHEKRKRFSLNARKSSWKFERNIILQEMLEHYKKAIINHQDPTYIQKHMLSSPEAAGKSMLSFLCCNFYLMRIIFEPLLQTMNTVQIIVTCASECAQSSRSKISDCCCIVKIKEGYCQNRLGDIQRKGKNYNYAWLLVLANKVVHVISMSASVFIILLISYAAFTV